MNDVNFFSSSVLYIMDVSKFMLVGLVLTICALIFQVIGLASPYWIFAEFGGNKAYSGLWKSCSYTKVLDTTVCNDLPNVQGDQYCYNFFYFLIILDINHYGENKYWVLIKYIFIMHFESFSTCLYSSCYFLFYRLV